MNKITLYKQKGTLLRRFITLVAGMFIAAAGVSMSVKANLGTSPMGCCPAVASGIAGLFGIEWLTVGNCMWIMLSLFVLLQIILLRRDFEWIQLLQLLVAFVYGYFTDFTALLMKNLNPDTYIEQWFWCLVAVVLLGVGVFLEVKADLVMLSGEGLALALAKGTKMEFHKTKIAMDCTMVGLAIIASLAAFHGLSGVREGTVAAAILVGMVVKFCMKHFTFFINFLEKEK